MSLLSTPFHTLIPYAYSFVVHQDEAVDDDQFLELAECCARTCHILKTVTEVDADNPNQTIAATVKSIEKYVRPTQTSVYIYE